MGGRPDPGVARARSLVRTALADLGEGDLVLVACSGGPDSLALAAATAFAGTRRGLRVGAAVVDHGLQPGSAGVAERAATQLRGLGLAPVERLPVEVGGSGGPEGSARRQRYAALRATAARHDAAAVLLGHTLDDQAETVLLGLARGSGPRAIAGMRAVDGLWRRPLLGFTRAETRQVCAASGLEPWDDPHNGDTGYARVRVRQQALPALRSALGPGVAEALARTADLMRDDADLLDRLAGDAGAGVVRDDGALDVPGLAALPAALRSRVLRTAALDAGSPAADLAAVHVREVDRLVTAWHGQLRVDLPGGVRAERHAGALSFRQPHDLGADRPPHPPSR